MKRDNKLRLASCSWKDNSTGLGDPYLVEPNCSGKPLMAYFGFLPFWSARILLANIAEAMKYSDSKKLAPYTLAHSIALAPSLPLLIGFAVESLLK